MTVALEGWSSARVRRTGCPMLSPRFQRLTIAIVSKKLQAINTLPSAEEDDRVFERALRRIVERLNGLDISVILSGFIPKPGLDPSPRFEAVKRTARTAPRGGTEKKSRSALRCLF